jgi:hypothetical protein
MRLKKDYIKNFKHSVLEEYTFSGRMRKTNVPNWIEDNLSTLLWPQENKIIVLSFVRVGDRKVFAMGSRKLTLNIKD